MIGPQRRTSSATLEGSGARRAVVVVGAHLQSGPSMHRYTRHVKALYEHAGWPVIVWSPPCRLTRLLMSSPVSSPVVHSTRPHSG